jgi:hypothetical protein
MGHPAAVDGPPGGFRRVIRLSRANDGTVGRFGQGQDDDLVLMKNDYNCKDGSRSLRDENKRRR